jgi:hypothetical protein
MRTTVNISDHLLAEAKATAARGGQTLGEVIDDALRALLAQQDTAKIVHPRVVLTADGGSGLQPGVELEDRAALAEILGENRAPRTPG